LPQATWTHPEGGFYVWVTLPEGVNAKAMLPRAVTERVAYVPGTAFFDSAMSFAIIRGGHVDVTVLGGLQVDQDGNLANWMVPGKMVPGMGGAMDLVTGAKNVIVTMEHATKDGGAKILKRCNLPLTAAGKVRTIITELALFRFNDGCLVLLEIAPGVTLEQIRARTEAEFFVSPDCRTMPVPG